MRKYLIILSVAILVAMGIYVMKSQKKSREVEIISSYQRIRIPEDKWLSRMGTDVQVDQEKVSWRNYYIIFDGSGSMRGEKLVVAKKALIKFIEAIPENANIGLTAFDRSGNFERASLGSAKEYIASRVEKIHAGGATPLGQSTRIAYGKLTEQAKKQLGYGEYNLVIITDGMATDKGILVDIVRKILAESPVIIHTIGFQIGTGHPLNQPGQIYYKTANNYDELSQGLEKVLAEIEDYQIMDF